MRSKTVMPRRHIVTLKVTTYSRSPTTCALLDCAGHDLQPEVSALGQRKNKFFARSTGGKYEPDVDQLREINDAARSARSHAPVPGGAARGNSGGGRAGYAGGQPGHNRDSHPAVQRLHV